VWPIRTAIDTWAHPYDPTVDRVGRTTRVASYTNLGNVTDQKVWLDSISPIACGFDVYYDFFAWHGSTPYKKSPNATYDGGHVMLLVGYDDNLQCWIAVTRGVPRTATTATSLLPTANAISTTTPSRA